MTNVYFEIIVQLKSSSRQTYIFRLTNFYCAGVINWEDYPDVNSRASCRKALKEGRIRVVYIKNTDVQSNMEVYSIKSDLYRDSLTHDVPNDKLWLSKTNLGIK